MRDNARPAAVSASEALRRLRAAVAAADDAAATAALAALERPDGAFATRLLEAIANGVITVSPQGTIATFNRAAETTFGVESRDVLGLPAATLGRVIRKLPELLETFFKSGAVQLRAEVAARRNGVPPVLLEVRLSPLQTAEGLGVAIVVIDITRQRDLEDRHAAQVVRTESVRQSFSRYLAPHLVQSLMDDPASLKLGGERTRATTLFADVRGFTRIASRLSPERVVEILNAYFDEAVRIVFAFDGLLDKFYGDGVMAVFGPPRVRTDDASRAVDAAVALHDVMENLRARVAYPLEISVGLATGYVVAGHFGSTRRMDYTVVGEAVNLAHALQSAAPAGAIYCDAETRAAVGDVKHAFERTDIELKGETQRTAAYAVATARPAAPPA